MHDEILRFSYNGELADTNIVKAKERLIESIEGQMRDEGAVPVLDMDPQFTLDYRPDTETYNFSLTVYGAYVGGNTSWQTAGIMSGTRIMKSTPPAKLKESSNTAE